ncbi:hypothetical protein D3C78_1178890 [compost metagenome]
MEFQTLSVWGARGRVFESLRPDHIIQGVARFYLATPFYFTAFLPLQNDWLSVESSLRSRELMPYLAVVS